MLVSFLSVAVSVCLVVERFPAPTLRSESPLFAVLAVLGNLALSSSADVLVVYLALELSGLSIYALACSSGRRAAQEAVLKYLFVSAVSSSVLLISSSSAYAITGSTSLALLSAHACVSYPAALALTVILAAVLMKLAAAPVHT